MYRDAALRTLGYHGGRGGGFMRGDSEGSAADVGEVLESRE